VHPGDSVGYFDYTYKQPQGHNDNGGKCKILTKNRICNQNDLWVGLFKAWVYPCYFKVKFKVRPINKITSIPKTYFSLNPNNALILTTKQEGSGRYNFTIDKEGSLYARNANIGGTIMADFGRIGGFDITDTMLSASGIGMSSNKQRSAFWAGDKFFVAHDGSLHATGATISGTITADTGKIGPLDVGTTSLNVTGASSSNYYTSITSNTIRTENVAASSVGASYYTGGKYEASTISGGLYVGGYITAWGFNELGGVYSSGGPTVVRNTSWTRVILAGENYSSDERIKKEIKSMDIRYENLFDLLEPKQFKYTNGNSDRIHTGFIAQDILKAMEKTSLTTQEFATVFLESPNTERECWCVRKDEIVALNTWQIQKLKPRVSTLEQTILGYETRISTLEQELENLKNPQNSDII
jgi:hypothetical protein